MLATGGGLRGTAGGVVEDEGSPGITSAGDEYDRLRLHGEYDVLLDEAEEAALCNDLVDHVWTRFREASSC